MKRLTKLSVLIIVLFLTAEYSYAQVSASASINATIVNPIAISKTVDLNFGNVAVGAIGTVVLSPASNRTTTGGVTLPSTQGTVAAASFIVSGKSNYTYSITLPSEAITINDAGSNSMTVSAWTSTPTSTGTLTGGTSTLLVGATLNINAGQTPGVYTSATPLNIIVNYN